MKVKNPPNRWQPVIFDERGDIRKRFNELKKKTRIEKSALAEKIFLIGIPILEKEIERATQPINQ